MNSLVRRSVRSFALLAALTCAAPGAPARAQAWHPEKLTILLGHAATGTHGRAAQALAKAWHVTLGAPVVVLARGRNSMLQTAGEFVRSPRDGRFVLAGDLGQLALSYARERPNWLWERSLEHFGVFGVDPAVLYTSASGGPDQLTKVIEAARARSYPVAVGVWESLETLVLYDAARNAQLRFQVVPVGEGAGLFDAVTGQKVPVGFGRMSSYRGEDRAISVLAVAGALGHQLTGGVPTLDGALGAVLPAAGYFDVLTVHANFQRLFPARYESLKRSFLRALTNEDYLRAIDDLGLNAKGTESADHDRLLSSVREWWDAARNVNDAFGARPAQITTRGKLTAVEDDGHRLRYLGLDGKIHDLHLDPDLTAVLYDGIPATDADPLARLKVGMLCRIALPSPVALQASSLSCK